MPKYIKKYNKDTKEWEAIGFPSEVNTTNPSNDTEVIVTNPNYANGETTTLDKALDTISDDISRLKRNVSWLAEHKGEGGGGVITGSTNNYKISVIGINKNTNGIAYVRFDNNSLSFQFQIVGGTKKDVFNFSVLFDEKQVKAGTMNGGNKVTVNISDVDDKPSHSLYIQASDQYGTIIEPYEAIIAEQTLSISMQSTSLQVPVNNAYAIIPVNVRNSLRGNGRLIFTDTKTGDEYTKNFSMNSSEATVSTLWREIKQNVSVGSQYAIKVHSEVIIDGSSMILKSNEITFYVIVTSSDDVTIMLSNITEEDAYEDSLFDKEQITEVIWTEGSDSIILKFNDGDTKYYDISKYIDESKVLVDVSLVEDTKNLKLNFNDDTESIIDVNDIVSVSNASINETFAFGFTPYISTTIARDIYYAIKIVDSSDNTLMLSGKHFDDNSLYRENPWTSVGSTVPVKWYVEEGKLELGLCRVYVKCWANETKYTTKVGVFMLNESGDIFFPYQRPYIEVGDEKVYKCFARWNTISEDKPETSMFSEWVSTQKCLYHTDDRNSTEIGDVKVKMQVFNANGTSSGLIDNALKFQGNARAVIDLSQYSNETRHWVTKELTDTTQGFALSVTFETDTLVLPDKVVLFWGNRNKETREITNGIEVGINYVTWVIGGKIINANIGENKKTTLDFVYDVNNGSPIVKLFVDGVIKKAESISNEISPLSDSIYIASDEEGNNTSDVNIYSISIFNTALSDISVVINAKNSKIEDYTDENTIADYIKWKNNNLFYSVEGDSTIHNALYDDSGYIISDDDLYTRISSISPIPVVYIKSTNNGEFTSSYFFNTTTQENVTGEKNAKEGIGITYFDPETNRTVSIDSCKVGIQGTSSTNFRSKNLEMYLDAKVDETDDTKTQLFQPKETWFPEREFTLKADVMDSSHANNSTLGKWINNCPLFEENPAQIALKENRPFDYDHNGEVIVQDGVALRHESETIKNSIEGFPVIVIARFADENGSKYNGKDVLLGIYSFNIGRYSYYNLGMKFFKGFSRRNENDADQGCPCLVDKYDYYKPTDLITYNNSGDTINMSDIYSFEFIQTADENNPNYPLWSQSDISVIKHIGEFKFNGQLQNSDDVSNDDIWQSLSRLFGYTAIFGDVKNYYVIEGKDYKLNPNKIYTRNDEKSANGIVECLSVQNAIAYYIVANVFGLTDSLGKNFTLRTWDGKKWWPCFYDLDTALGLDNNGAENISCDAYVDSYENKTKYKYLGEDGNVHEVETRYAIPTTIPDENITKVGWSSAYNDNEIIITENSPYSRYSCRAGKLWNIFRDKNTSFWYHYNGKKYSDVWFDLRKNILKTSDDFVSLMESQMGDCGELLFNSDYNFKYITKYKKTEEGEEVYGDINKLHGNRVDYVRDWLKKRIYFLDGVFEPNIDLSCPYNNTSSIAAAGFEGTSPKVTVRTSSPFILTFGLDQTRHRYFIPENEYTDIYLIKWDAQGGKNVQINGTDILTLFRGFDTIRLQSLGDQTNFKYFSEISLRNCNMLNNNAIKFEQAFVYTKNDDKKNSYITDVNLSNTKFGTSSGNNFSVNLSGDTYTYGKLRSVDISNSCVTSLVLPPVSLSYLNIKNSNLTSFKLSSQSLLSELSFDGCKNLFEIEIDRCNSIESLDFSNLASLQTVKITNCDGLKNLTFKNNKYLYKVDIVDNRTIENITFESCEHSALTINYEALNNTSTLKSITINKMENLKTINLGKSDTVKNVEKVIITNSYNFEGFEYKDKTYKSGILDISCFENMNSGSENGLTISVTNIKEIKVRNDEHNPFKLFARSFADSKIEKLHGYFDICGNYVFNKCKNFSFDDDFDFTISTTDLSNCFANTKISADDVIKVLDKCDNVDTLESTFFEVDLVGSEINERHLFKKCSNVVNMTNTFAGTGLIIHLYGDILHYDEELKDEIVKHRERGTMFPLRQVTAFASTFKGCNVITHQGILWQDLEDTAEDMTTPPDVQIKIWIFGPCGMGFEGNITEDYQFACTAITEFNPTSADGEVPAMSTVLANLSHLKTIENSFNNFRCAPDGDGGTFNLFGNNNELRVIDNSFKDLFISTSTRFDNSFPNSLNRINASFIFNAEGDADIKLEYTEEFFNGLTNLNFLGGDNSNRPFSGQITKIIKQTEDGNFPYSMLKHLVNIETLNYFFSDCEFEGGGTVEINDSLFEGLTRLREIEGLFDSAKFSYTISEGTFDSLTGLTNVSRIFAGNTNYANFGLRGNLPYGLFRNNTRISNFSHILYNVQNGFAPFAIDYEKYPISENSNYVTKIGAELKWNKYFTDGSSEGFWTKVGNSDFYNNLDDGNHLKELSYGDDVLDNEDKYIAPKNLAIIDRKTSENFICPPDIFSYSNNISNIDYAFASQNIYGVVPYMLLEKINVSSISGLFEGTSITPIRYTENGQLYLLPYNLFSKVNNLSSVVDLFSGQIIPYGVIISDKIFAKNNSLTNISGMFKGATIDFNKTEEKDYEYFITMLKDAFEDKNITSVNEMFKRATIPMMSSDIFSQEQIERMVSAVGFMASANLKFESDVPEFWDNEYADGNNFRGCYYSINANNIDDRIRGLYSNMFENPD